MSTVEGLLQAFRRQVALPWERVAPPQRVWFVIYPPAQERRLRFRIDEFRLATREADHGWRVIDLTDSFAHWMAAHEYREAYFEHPEDMEFALDEFRDHVIGEVTTALTATDVDSDTLVAVVGVGSLFGFMRTSAILDAVGPSIRGRLLVFFPGQREGNNFRLMEARDGWNYQAVVIEAAEGS